MKINKVYFDSETAKIILNKNIVALIDKEDYFKVKNLRWYSKRGRYSNYVHSHPWCAGKHPEIRLHRLIMGCPEGMVVDHINHDGLDNRKSNLRVVTASENCINRKKQINNTSGFPGVSWDKEKNKWSVRISFQYKDIKLGRTFCLKKAIELRKIGEAKYFPRIASPVPLDDGPEPVMAEQETPHE